MASELRLTDAAELVAMTATITPPTSPTSSIPRPSSSSRAARCATLSASVTAPWDATPVVSLDMEFRHAMVSAFFRLTIGQRQAGIENIDVLFDEKGLTERAKAERLMAALASARVRGRAKAR